MIEVIEKNLGIKYSDLFHKLNIDGMLDWGRYGPHWYKEFYPILRKKPPFLLFVGDFELIEMDKIEVTALKIKSKSGSYPHLVPFGKTGAGELYCFVFDRTKSLDSICLFNKWADQSIKLAKTFEDFMFRELLSAVVEINPDDFQDDEQSFAADLLAMLASHKPYLSEHRFSILEGFYAEPFLEQEDTFGALSLNDFFEIIKQEIGFNELNQKFDDLVYVY